MSWYALFVKTGKEDDVQKWLKFYFKENTLFSLLPKRRLMERKNGIVKNVLKKIFPSYVFIHVDISEKIYYRLKQIPNIIRILKTDEYIAEINEKEMLPILEILDDNGIVDYSKVYQTDSGIIVESGPLKGREGLIIAVDKRKRKVKIKLKLMGAIREFYVGVELLSFVLKPRDKTGAQRKIV